MAADGAEVGGVRGRVFGYRAPGRWTWYLVFPVFGVVSVVIVTTAIVNGEPPIWFALLWVGVAVWNGYWFSWQIGHSIEVRDGQVTWRTVLRSRTVPLADIGGVEPFWIGFHRIAVADAPSMLITGGGRGWVRFLERMQAENGRSGFEPSGIDRALGWMPELTGGYYEGP